MSYEVNRTNFFLSTSQRQAGGTPSDFTIPLFKPITLSKPTNYFKIKFNTVSMPYSWKQLEEFPYISGCTFSWNGGPTTTFNIQFEPGNYNILGYLDELSIHLIPELALLAPTNDLVYNFTYNQPQGWVVLNITSPSNTPFNLKLGTAPQVGLDAVGAPFIMCTVLGFPSNSTGVVFNGANPTNTSTNQINCSPISALFIRSVNLRVIAYESLIEPSVPSDILCKIDVITQPYTIINWWNNIDLETRLNTQVIDNLSFQLTASNSYNPINMHGSDWYLGLSILEFNDPVAEGLVNRFNSGGVGLPQLRGPEVQGVNNPSPPLENTPSGPSSAPLNSPPVSGSLQSGQPLPSDGAQAPSGVREEADNAEIQAELENLKAALHELGTAEAEESMGDDSSPTQEMSDLPQLPEATKGNEPPSDGGQLPQATKDESSPPQATEKSSEEIENLKKALSEIQ
jgi:hypothetical protein